MKKLCKILYISIICALSALVLSGCAPIFDALNFNRKPLVAIPSQPEAGLENKYERQDNVLTKAQLIDIVDETIKARTSFLDSVKITYVTSGSWGYPDYEHETSLTLLDRSTVVDDNITDNRHYPYAEYRTTVSRYSSKSGSSVQFVDGGFFISHIVDNYTYPGNILYVNDEYIGLVGLDSYNALADGGMFKDLFLELINDFETAALDYSNGKQILIFQIKESFSSHAMQYIPSDVPVPSYYGEYSKMSSIDVRINAGKIERMSFHLDYNAGSLLFDIKLAAAAGPLNYSLSSDSILPSYCYALDNLRGKYAFVTDNYSETPILEYKANVEFKYFPELAGLGDSGELSFYSVANPFHTKANAWRNPREIYVLEFDDEMVYSVGSWMFERTPNSPASFVSSSIAETYVGYRRAVQFAINNPNIPTDSTYEYTFTQLEDGSICIEAVFEIIHGDEVFLKYKSSFVVNSDFSRFISFKTEQEQENECIFLISVEFDYSASCPIPQIIGDELAKLFD